MASVDLEYNQGFKIYNANGTRFNNLVLHKATYETVVMSLGDKISGIVYYKNNKLVVNMTEYIMYKDVKYVLVNPPTVIKEGLVSDNGELKGMTKYSFTFYHPMYMLSNFPFSDIAVSTDQQRYLSQNKTFSWIGNLTDYVAKLNKNLEGTQWKVSIGTNVTDAEKNKLSEVLSFDNNTIADALKTAYETWEIPYVIDQTYEGNKRFLVRFGLPNNEIYEKDKNGNFILDDNNQKIPFVFKYGQGVGLKNNSRTPKNNKIVTRIAGYGSEDNIPYGYPQIVWTGNQDWNYTINNASGMQTITVGGRTIQAMSYPIYDGIVGGQKVRLIKHPFTRTHLMPPIYRETVNKKVNPNATGYNPNTELVDYYDANGNTYPNQIKAGEPSYEIHEFEDIKPEFDSSGIPLGIDSATPYDGHSDESISQDKFLSIVDDLYTETDIKAEKTQLNALRTSFVKQQQNSVKGTSGNYEYDWSFKTDGLYKKVKYASSGANFEYVVKVGLTPATIDWDDTMDEQGNYVQSYFKVTIPALGFDLYASAAITQEMTINMRSGACIGCSFPVMVDWDDYKRNFYDKDGNFAPNGTQRNLTKYPNSTNASITLILQKETNTFGTLMPNIYQKPASGDKFVILGISLPTSYITTAEGKLETEMKKYMRDNNVYYYEYPLKFDEHFLISNEHILSQMKPNVIVNFEYADVEQSLYIKQMSIKYNESPLPKYDITLTDDVDVVLNKIGEAIAEYRGQRQYENGGGNSETLDGNKFLRKDINDTASGTIRMLKGLQVGERFVTGLLGEGGIFRKDDDGTTYLECDRMYVRMKAYFDTVEVRRFLHSGGNRIASAAGMKCSRVEYIAKYGNTYVVVDANGQYWVNNRVIATLPIERYRCYFRAEDNGAKITNDFVIGDLAYCKETNIDTNLSQHGYWRAIVDVSGNANANGEHWIDLSASDCLSGSDIPIAQDDIIQLGNKTDKKRQGAIVEFVSGEDAPSYQIYQGINTYDLKNKNYIGLGYSSEKGRAYMNVYGDMFVGVKPDAITGKSPTYIKYVQDDGTEQHKPKLTIKGVVEMLSPDDPEETTTLDDFAKAITGDIEYLQQQIDGEIDTWFYDGVPTLTTEPAKDWTTDNEKKEHLGDLYYDKLNGNAYRFIYDKDSETYSWLLLSDSAILEALRIANEAKDTADNKRRVFLTDAQHPHPTPPYDEGDLWVNAVWPYQGQNIGSTYNDEILKCIKPVPREEGGSDVTVFSIGDWSAANGYKTALSDFINNTYASFVTNIQTQVDRKAQTWYLSFDPSYSWAGNEKQHVGDLWYCTDDIENTDYKKNTTWIYQEKIDPDTGETVYYWAEAAVPDEVFDMIDGKSAIYTEWEAWIDESGASSLQVRDLLIPAADIVRGNVTYKQNKVYRCTNRNTQNPVFEEIAYTDDSAFSGYINAILNGTGSSGDAATVAAAQKAIKEALGNGTLHEGGLVLTSLIGMRDKQNKVWAGINGQYQPAESGTGYKGHGIAAWYGGGMADWEVYFSSLTPAQQKTATISDTYAKSLFRFDGSGYLAGGNITWDAQGRVAIKDITTLVGGNDTDILNALTTFNNAFHFTTQQGTSTILNINPQYAFSHLEIYDANGNHSVATTDYVNDNFVTKAFFNRLFQAYSSSTIVDANKVLPNDTTTAINNLKILVGTWTEQYLSALGNNPNASGGGGISDLSAVLNELNSKDDLGTGVLVRNGLNNWSWMPYNTGTSGIDENAMWTALGTSSNQKIDNSHLSLNSLTFKAGASDTTGVAYLPTGDAKTITFDAAANSGISVTKDNNGTFIIGYTMPNVTLSTTISDSDTSYTRFVVDAKGRVVKADKPTTLSGYGITDAVGSATKWWGKSIQTVNNEKVVKGDMTDVGSITMDGNIKMLKDKSLDIKIGESYYSALGTWSASNLQMLYLGYYTSTQEGAGYATSVYGNTLRLFGSSTTLGMYIDNDGNVGVGKWSPSYRLDVEGTVNATEFRVGSNYITTQDATNKYLKIVTDKNELIVGKTKDANETGDSKTLHINYRTVSESTTKSTITDYQWHAGSSTTWASHRVGRIYLYRNGDSSSGTNARNVYIEIDENGDVKLNGNFYATGAVSALGSKSSGGQDYFNADMMWQELGTDSTAKLISQSHLNLSGYALTDDVTKTLTIKQDGQNDVVYNGTEAKTITISGGAGDRLRQYTLADGASLSTFTHTTDFIYTAKGGENGCTDKPEGVDAFGLISFKTAVGYYGQILMPAGVGRLYLRSSNSLNGGWSEVALTSDLTSYAKKEDIKKLTVKTGAEAQGFEYSPGIADATLTFKAADNSGISVARSSGTITIGLDASSITAGKATQLASNVTLWGNAFNGTQSIGYKDTSEHTASLSYVQDITMSGNVKMNRGQFIQMYVNDGYRNVLGTDSVNNILSLGYRTAEQGFDTRIFGTDVRLWYYNSTDTWKEGMTLTNAGRVGIGTTDPQYKFDVNGTAHVSSDITAGSDILMENNKFIRIKNAPAQGATAEYVNMIGIDSSNRFSVFYGALKKQYTTGIYGYDVNIGHGNDNGQDGAKYFTVFRNTGHVTINAYDDTDTTRNIFLNVGGSTKTNRLYLFTSSSGDVYLEYDNVNKGVHLVGAGLWTDSYISALGSKSSGGQDYFDAQRMWEELGNYDTKKIDNSHLSLYSLSFTTSAGTIEYNPTTGGQTIDLSSVSGNYLPLSLPSGGKSVAFADLNSTVTFHNTASKWVAIGFKGQDEYLGFLSVSKNTNGYVTPFFVTAGSSTPYEDGVSGWYALLHAGNSSVSKSGETLTVKINGISQSLTNTWRGIQDNLTSTSTTESLSALQGKTLYGYITTLQGHFTNGVANSAAKLTTTSKTLWGNTYWTSGGVPTSVGYDSSHTASLSYVKDITMSGSIKMGRDKYICFQTNDDSYIPALGIFQTYNVLNLGYEIVNQKSYDTNIYGNSIVMFSKVSGTITKGFSLNTSGNVCIGDAYPSSTVGDILALSPASSSSYTAILYYRPSGYASWSVAANNSNSFYWYTWGGGASGTMMSLTNTGSLTLGSAKGTYIKIGGATLKWTDNGLECDQHFYSKGAVSALGSNTSGGGSQIELTGLLAAMYGKDMPSGSGALYYSGGYWSFQPISSGTSGDYIPLSGSDAITGDLKPQNYNSAQNTGCDLGNDSKRWRQIWGRNFIGETIELLEDKIELNFRATQHNNFGCKVGYRTYGDEALVFANKNASTSFIFYTGSELITDENNTYSGGSYGTPALQIKQNSVYINRPIINGVSPSYELYVNGRSYADEVWVGNYQDNRDVYFKRYNTQGGGILDIMAPQGARLNATTTVTSDMRLKNIVSFVDNLTVEGVAMAPIFNFKWKDRPKGFTSVGTSAQYWQSTLPNVVIDLDNILSLDYGATALASAVITARKVVDHEQRIKQLEQENAILRKEIEELKAA